MESPRKRTKGPREKLLYLHYWMCGEKSGAPPMPCVSYFPWTSAPRMARMVHWSKTIQAVKIWNSYVD